MFCSSVVERWWDCGVNKNIFFHVLLSLSLFSCRGSSIFATAHRAVPASDSDSYSNSSRASTDVPSVLSINFKDAFYASKGQVVSNVAVVVAFGPGFEKVLEKKDQMYPDLHPSLSQLTKREVNQKKAKWDKMIHMTVPELIKNGGNYRWREHTVVTDDHYILTIFQIRKKQGCQGTLPVLFMHDFLGTAADWLMVDPEDAIPFDLVDRGYEVWLLNGRGNEYSNRHQFYKLTDPSYWKFSFHEQGKFDLPAVVKHVKKHTETQSGRHWDKKQVSFVGSGMGTTVFYVYLSLYGRNETRNIYSLAALTPTAFLSRTQSPLRLFAPLANDYFPFNKDGPLDPPTLAAFLHHAVPELCPLAILKNISLCTASSFLRSTDYSSDLSTRVMRRVFGHYPSTTSIRTFLHYIQLVTKPKFSQFNFGPLENFRLYEQLVPLQYNLFNMTVASINLYGQKDVTVDHRDVERTTSEVGVEVYQNEIMALEQYTNVDFMYGSVGVHFARFAVLESIRLRACNAARNKKPEANVCEDADYLPVQRNTHLPPKQQQQQQQQNSCQTACKCRA